VSPSDRVKIVLATFNRDKVRELKALLPAFKAEVLGLWEIPGAKVPPEAGRTLYDNAIEKARAAYDLTGETCIADDTGLEVDVLGGKPGIYAARFAGPGASYADNVRRLLEVLEGHSLEARTARFRTCVAACLTDGRERSAEGVLEGRITLAPRGRNGFGYDPIFEVGASGRTLAEMTAEEKNATSHRSRAMRALLAQLELV
jgi:XTP/dITP diphosphohydrolase